MNAQPLTASCSGCHSFQSKVSNERTPVQTAGYRDDELIEVFRHAHKPKYGFSASFLKMRPDAECLYRQAHTYDIDDETARGLVWLLRSIAPRVDPDLDKARLQ
jgi:hypothetical protein